MPIVLFDGFVTSVVILAFLASSSSSSNEVELDVYRQRGNRVVA